MNLQEYKIRREQLQNAELSFRELCSCCLQPQFGCYCKEIERIDPKMKVVILIHPIEVKRRIATGRMSHLCLINSHLIKGQDFTNSQELNSILNDSRYQPVILYPGHHSANISEIPLEQQKQMFSSEKKLALIVIDGTWATAGRMIRQSQNLIDLPRVCFTPSRLSQFRVRKQPAPECLSTIEAIHQTIDLLKPVLQLPEAWSEHNKLLKVFDSMVERQLSCIRDSYDHPRVNTYRRPKVRIA